MAETRGFVYHTHTLKRAMLAVCSASDVSLNEDINKFICPQRGNSFSQKVHMKHNDNSTHLSQYNHKKIIIILIIMPDFLCV